jgi:hypothetical protein
MTLTLDADLESRLRERAQRDGVTPDALAADAVARGLELLDAEAAQDAEDLEAARLVMADGEAPIPFAQFEAELEAERDAERARDGQAHREAA